MQKFNKLKIKDTTRKKTYNTTRVDDIKENSLSTIKGDYN